MVFSAVALGVATSLPSLTRLAHTSLWALQASRNPASTLDIDAKVSFLLSHYSKLDRVHAEYCIEFECTVLVLIVDERLFTK